MRASPTTRTVGRTAGRTLLGVVVLLGAATVPACSEQGAGTLEDGPGCLGGKCDDEEDGLRSQLAQLDDPIAQWLKDNVDDDGTIELDYLEMLRGISDSQGCADDQIDSYIISDGLVAGGDDAFPRVVNTVCSTDRQLADLAFFALSFPNGDGTDLDAHRVEMFAWDNTEKRYRFYKTEAVDETLAEVHLEPDECTQCHLTPRGVDNHRQPMTPIMNELQAPWEHWFAEPVTLNHSVPASLDDAPHYQELAGSGSPFRKSASRLEGTIKSAFNQRVAVGRAGIRREKPALIEDAMSALRPLFCDEQLTYASEDGSSGLLDAGAVIDDGWHSVFFVTQGTGWPWEWWNDRKLRLPGGGERINMMPVRGASVVTYEKQFMNLRGLSATKVARIRALDWHTPVMSDFRCGLFEAALPRVMENPPVEIDDTTRNSTLMSPLLDAILTVHPDDFGLTGLPDEVPLSSAGEGTFIALASADPESLETLLTGLAQGTLGDQTCDEADGAGVCVVTLEQMGGLLEARFKGLESDADVRGQLQAERDRRACAAKDTYGAFPHVDGLDCG